MRRHPHLLELNALLFLRRVERRLGRRVGLGGIPDGEWAAIRARGFDLVWLMGVWRRSPGARARALINPGVRGAIAAALTDARDDDVVASPYAVAGYTLDPELGGADDLARVRERLHAHGLGLIVDFVPNHLALDHPWVVGHPDRFVRASAEDLRAHPERFFTADGGATWLAHGRNPYFPPWTDTVQVDFSAPAARTALVAELARIAAVADGVRCDMAMLALDGVFRRVWGEVVRREPPAREFWDEAIAAVRAIRPDFLLLAEVYWGLDHELRRLGFDYTYDKDLYDRLRSGSPDEVRTLLAAPADEQASRARFIENHDEERAAAAFGRERARAAAVAVLTLPGLRFVHDGQTQGWRRRIPVQLGREPEEADDAELASWYARVLALADGAVFHDGDWELLAPAGGERMLAWRWRRGGELAIVAVNLTAEPARGSLPLPPGAWSLHDPIADVGVTAATGQVTVELAAWESLVLVTLGVRTSEAPALALD